VVEKVVAEARGMEAERASRVGGVAAVGWEEAEGEAGLEGWAVKWALRGCQRGQPSVSKMPHKSCES
jgi:hypothetical protein